MARICFEIDPYGSDLAQNSVWHTNSASYVDLDRSRTQIPLFFLDFIISVTQKPSFLKTKKKYLKKIGRSGGQSPPAAKKVHEGGQYKLVGHV